MRNNHMHNEGREYQIRDEFDKAMAFVYQALGLEEYREIAKPHIKYGISTAITKSRAYGEASVHPMVCVIAGLEQVIYDCSRHDKLQSFVTAVEKSRDRVVNMLASLDK